MVPGRLRSRAHRPHRRKITNKDYIAHHNAPQYFGYEANNPVETKAHMKGLGDFYTEIKG